MVPNLPRPLLWTEIKTMNEFLSGDLLASLFYRIFKELQGSIFLSYVNEVALFNEFYYQLTRYYYEKPEEDDYYRYYADIRTNLGRVECADLVMVMMFHYCRIREIHPLFRITPFMRSIIIQQENTAFWQYFMTIRSTMSNWFDFTPYPQKPCPTSPKTLEKLDLDWKTITQNFDLTTIHEILGLWGKEEDKNKVASMIKVKLGSLILFTHIPKRELIEYNKSVEYLEDLTRKKDEVKASSTTSIESLEREVKELKKKNSQISAERDKYKKMVDELRKNFEEKLKMSTHEVERMKEEKSKLEKQISAPQILLTNNSNFARVVQAMVSARYFKRANGDETNATEVGGLLLKLFGVTNTWKSVLQKAFSRENPLKTYDDLRDAGEKYWTNRLGLTEDIRKKGKKIG